MSAHAQVWHRVSKEVLQPDDPFELHQLLFRSTYHSWQPAQQVGPVSVHPNSCAKQAVPSGLLMVVLPCGMRSALCLCETCSCHVRVHCCHHG